MALTFTVTNSGRIALVNAANTGTAPVTIAQVGLTATAVVPSPAATALPGEHKRIATLSGDVVADDVIHLIVRDDSADIFTVRSIGLYLNDGTLFGVYGQSAVLLEKSAQAMMLLGIDVKFEDITAASISFGDANFLNPPATTERQGVVELTTVAEAQAGIDALRALTPSAAKAAVLGWLLAQDGSGSGLDADLLDGQHGSYYANITARLGYTPVQQGTGPDQGSNVIKIGWGSANRLKAAVDASDQGNIVLDANLASGLLGMNGAYVARNNFHLFGPDNDGSGSGMDADLLDGQEGSYYSNIVARLGYSPIQQGTGAGQTANVVKIGWSGSRLKATVDTVDQGNMVFDSHIADVWRASNDGSGSGLDADLLDGQDGSYYSNIVARLGYTPVQLGTGVGQLGNTVKIGWSGSRLKATVDNNDQGNMVFDGHIADVWRSSNDGSGSGMDADLLDGQDGSYYSNIVARLGFTPIRQGGGVDQLSNDVRIGWNGARLKATVDGGDQGNMVFDGHIADVWRASNDGSGSGLDADLLDGFQAADFLRDIGNSMLQNGYVRLSNGLILQWGSIAGTWAANTDISGSYPIAFPNALLGIVGTNSDVAAQKDAVVGFNYTPAPTASSFRFRTNVAGQNRINWFAIGF